MALACLHKRGDLAFGVSSARLSLFQGVIEFSLCLLFAKLVSYTFLFWLPLYITNVGECLWLEARRFGSLQWLRSELPVTCSFP